MEDQQKIKTTPSDFFLHLGIIVALYISAVSLVSLLFSVINKVYPDALNLYYSSSSGSIRWAVAALTIMFPLYLILGWIYNKQLRQTPEKKMLSIRKWLVYFTLFIAGLTLAIDLIFLVYYLLGGEITMRFVLKVLSVLVVAGLIFKYYLLDVHSPAQMHSKYIKQFGILTIILVVGSIIAGFAIVGSPLTERKLQFDDQRVSNLSSLQYQIVNYWQQKQKLPTSLNDLKDPLSNYNVPVDPETNRDFSYEATGQLSFKLCANFDLASQAQKDNSLVMPMYPGSQNDSWQHGSGTQCFDRTIDPQMYPPFPKNAPVGL